MTLKRIISLTVCLCVLLSIFTFSASAEAGLSTDKAGEFVGTESKISAQLAKMISADGDAVIPVYIFLKDCVNRFKVEKYVLENYENADKDADVFLKYYRQEIDNIIGPYVQSFVDENKALIERIIFQSDGAQFIIADVYAYNIEKLAESDTVTEIAYFDNLKQVNCDKCYYKDKFIEAFDVNKYDGMYSYDEIYYHKDDNGVTDWALVSGNVGFMRPASTSVTIGNILVESSNHYSPFLVGYGVYDVNEDKFYSIEEYQYLPGKLNELTDVLKDLNIGTEVTPDPPVKPVVEKKANPVKVTAKTMAVKAKTLKAKKQTVKALTISKAQGKVTVALVKSGTTKAIRNKVTVSNKGAVTLKNGKYNKTTYNVKVKITAKGNSKYKSKTVTKTVKIKVK